MEYDWSCHEEKLLYIRIEVKTNGKIDRGRTSTSYMKRMTSDASLVTIMS